MSSRPDFLHARRNGTGLILFRLSNANLASALLALGLAAQLAFSVITFRKPPVVAAAAAPARVVESARVAWQGLFGSTERLFRSRRS